VSLLEEMQEKNVDGIASRRFSKSNFHKARNVAHRVDYSLRGTFTIPRHRSRFSLYIKRCFAIGGAAKWSILGVLFPLALAKVAPYGSKFRHARQCERSRSLERNAAAFARSKGNTQILGEARQLLPQFRSRTQLRTLRLLYFCRETRNRCGTARVTKIPSRVRDCERNACNIVAVVHRRRGICCNSRPGPVREKRLFAEAAWTSSRFLSLPNSKTPRRSSEKVEVHGVRIVSLHDASHLPDSVVSYALSRHLLTRCNASKRRIPPKNREESRRIAVLRARSSTRVRRVKKR